MSRETPRSQHGIGRVQRDGDIAVAIIIMGMAEQVGEVAEPVHVEGVEPRIVTRHHGLPETRREVEMILHAERAERRGRGQGRERRSARAGRWRIVDERATMPVAGDVEQRARAHAAERQRYVHAAVADRQRRTVKARLGLRPVGETGPYLELEWRDRV